MNLSQDKLTLGNLLNRITSPTPEFQKQVRNRMLFLAGVSGTILGISHISPEWVPVFVTKICKIVTLIAGTSAAHAQTTKDQSQDTPATDDTTATQN